MWSDQKKVTRNIKETGWSTSPKVRSKRWPSSVRCSRPRSWNWLLWKHLTGSWEQHWPLALRELLGSHFKDFVWGKRPPHTQSAGCVKGLREHHDTQETILSREDSYGYTFKNSLVGCVTHCRTTMCGDGGQFSNSNLRLFWESAYLVASPLPTKGVGLRGGPGQLDCLPNFLQSSQTHRLELKLNIRLRHWWLRERCPKEALWKAPRASKKPCRAPQTKGQASLIGGQPSK